MDVSLVMSVALSRLFLTSTAEKTNTQEKNSEPPPSNSKTQVKHSIFAKNFRGTPKEAKNPYFW